MKANPKQPTTAGFTEMFTGDVHFDVIAQSEPPSRLRVNTVRFAPGARTAWHRHANGQTLHVTDGRGLVQSRCGELIEMRPEAPSTGHPGSGAGTGRLRRTLWGTWRCESHSARARTGQKLSGGEHVSETEYPRH
ncbi:cupin domain-containing protein [Klugiella xanthotipulae]|uniref:Quercetin dioxygenase-like cupin family protein n=1 Tax=Klugiella xanthotipulae TaxID=244735 RepID=A0A543HGX8_9MICO|nr:cupin domain-containing protein [Klugiella xanthotipulae]TQM57584.1 hypothetical protein FB466_2578 [Klugiella xanthotipulae]